MKGYKEICRILGLSGYVPDSEMWRPGLPSYGYRKVGNRRRKTILKQRIEVEIRKRMSFFNQNPKASIIDLVKLKPEELEYYCTTKYIDKLVHVELNLAWDEKLADSLAENHQFFFVVTTDRKYDVISGLKFVKWLDENGLMKSLDDTMGERPASSKAQACRQAFVNNLVKQHKNTK